MIPIPFDYETLRLAWWALLGVLLAGFAVMDGYDMGVAALLLGVGRSDKQRRVMLNAIGPFWDGNQVWLLLGGGAVFAAWPAVYATAFSGFYLAMIVTLFTLILRPVGFEFRNKFPEHQRLYWDIGLTLAGVVPPLVFGVAFGNLFLGVPFYLDDFHLPHYVDSYFGGLFHLFNPFALLCGLVSLTMLATHGAVFLAAKTTGEVRQRAARVVYLGSVAWAVLFALGGLWVGHLDGYTLTSMVDPNGPSNPLAKSVTVEAGVWLRNYQAYPWLYTIPGVAFGACALTLLLTRLRRHATAFITSALTVAGTIGTAGVALFPFLLPSSYAPGNSLTVWDASASRLSLWLMLLAAVLFVPLVLVYTGWAFRVLREAVSEAFVENNSDHLY